MGMSASRRRVALILVVSVFCLTLVTSTFSQDPTSGQTLESDDPRVFQAGRWSTQTTAAASNGSYLFSSGAEEDILGLAFVGGAIEVFYVSGPQLGTLAIEVDGTVLRTVITTTAKIEYGQVARVDYLSDEPHTLKVYAQAGGVIAVDAFHIIPHSLTTLAVNDETGEVQASTCTPPNATHRVSLDGLGGQANNQSLDPDISADGRYVVFTSPANNLVGGDGDAALDVYVYDRTTCRIVMLPQMTSYALMPNIDVNSPAISDNGRFVALVTRSPATPPGAIPGEPTIYLYDVQSGGASPVAIPTGPFFPFTSPAEAYAPAVSSDGRYVAFESGSESLVSGDTNGVYDIFVRDRNGLGTTTRVNVATGGAQANGITITASISGDGRYVSFHSDATNLVTGDTNAAGDVFVHDRTTGITTRVSIATGGAQANGGSTTASISGDGRYVAFTSTATNLVAGDTNAVGDAFVHDRTTGTTTRVSVATGGSQANALSLNAVISNNGRYITFESTATNLVAGDTNAAGDIFVHDRTTGTTSRLSLSATAAQASGGGSTTAVIADNGAQPGYTVAFGSAATNLVIGDTNAAADIFVTRQQPPQDQLAIFQPEFELVGRYDLNSSPNLATAFTGFSAYAPPTTAGQWVMGDWDGDGQKTPGIYYNGPFYYTNARNEALAGEWRSLWVGVAGPPVSGRFNGALGNDCIGAVQTASLGGSTVFVLYYTCDLSGNASPTIANQWLSAVLPDGGGFSGAHQFKAGDFNGDGVDSIAVRRGTSIAFGNVAPATGPATFDLAQYIGTPQAGVDSGIFVIGDWDGNGTDSFGLFYQNGELFYRNDLLFNSGVYTNQSVGTPFAGTVQATTWR